MSEPAPPPVSAASSEALELPSLLAMVGELAATDAGRERAAGLRPLAVRPLLESRRRLYEEVERLLPGGGLVPSLDGPLLPLLEALEAGEAELEGGDLLLLAAVIAATGRLAARAAAPEEDCPALAALAAELPGLGELEREIGRVLDRRGRVRDDATPELAARGRRVRRLRESLYGQLEESRDRYREHLAEDTIPLQEGRLVLLVQTGALGRVKGLSHGRSASGRSVYFEPLEVVETNNRLFDSLEALEAERREVLTRLVASARAALPELRRHAELLAEVDLLQAAARLAALCGGRLAELSERHDLRLVAARHPLLAPELADLRERALGQAGHRGPAEPLDLELTGERRVLVVTGPNAGGKTVALKTVGLLALATQCGLPVPAAAGTRLPFFSVVMATVGDEQDLLSDRSTFSGRLQRLDRAWRLAAPDSLVLLDELGSGTDPEEGAALAVALLEHLLGQRTLAVITTHLMGLAMAALEAAGAACAAMEFDGASARPTYRLHPGPPGGSQALALARSLGLPAAWIGRAEELLGSESRDLRRLLAELEETRRLLAAAERRASETAQLLAGERERLAAEREALEEERRRLAPTVRRQLAEFRLEVGHRLGEEVETLRAELARGRRRRVVPEAVERLFREAPAVEEPPAPVDGSPARALAAGDRVRHAGLGWEGRLERLERGEAEVAVRGKRVRCDPDELEPVQAAAGTEPAAGERSGRGAAGRAGRRSRVEVHAAGADRGAPPELNLVGWRVPAALEELDAYLDRALLASRDEVRVVHGFGSGRLRRAVRDHLGPHPAVASFRPGGSSEGGDGATVVTLRGA